MITGLITSHFMSAKMEAGREREIEEEGMRNDDDDYHDYNVDDASERRIEKGWVDRMCERFFLPTTW